MAAAVRDPKTSALVRTLFADALATLAGRLTPEQAASLESSVVDSLLADLAEAKSRPFRGLVGRALGTVCGRPGATGAARAAEALATAIRSPQTRPEALKPLAAALAAAIGRLPPREASSHANQVVDVLDSLWVARTTPYERAALAEALAVVWTRLDPTDAAARAKRAAADLEGALRDSRATPIEIAGLAIALTAVYNHLGPVERSGRAKAVADTLVAVLQRPRNDLPANSQLAEALAALCAHLDRPGDVLLTVLDEPDIKQFRFFIYDRMFKRVAARLDERELQRLLEHPLVVGGLQRALLDVLAGSKKRSFRNTWDYLDGSASN
jgi:hypothetical protein